MSFSIAEVPLFVPAEITDAHVDAVHGYKTTVVFDERGQPIAIHPRAPKCLGNLEYRTARGMFQEQKCARCRPETKEACRRVSDFMLASDTELDAHHDRYWWHQGGKNKKASTACRAAFCYHWRAAAEARDYQENLDRIRGETAKRLRARAEAKRQANNKRRYAESRGLDEKPEIELLTEFRRLSVIASELTKALEDSVDVSDEALKRARECPEEFVAIWVAERMAAFNYGPEHVTPARVARFVGAGPWQYRSLTPAERTRLNRKRTWVAAAGSHLEGSVRF